MVTPQALATECQAHVVEQQSFDFLLKTMCKRKKVELLFSSKFRTAAQVVATQWRALDFAFFFFHFHSLSLSTFSRESLTPCFR